MNTPARYTLPETSALPTLSVTETRKSVGEIIGAAVHGHRPTIISRSGTEEAVVIARADYEALLADRNAIEALWIKDRMAQAARGEITMLQFADMSEFDAHFRRNADGTRIP